MRSIVISVLLFSTAALYGLRLTGGVAVPVSLGLSLAGNAGIWPGLIFGGGLTAGLDSSWFGLNAYGLFTLDTYFLPDDKYAAGSRITFYNIRYGLDAQVRFWERASVGFGPQCVYTIGGFSGTPGQSSNFTAGMTGQDIYLSLAVGYEIPISGRTLALPVQARVSYDLTVPNTDVMEFGLTIGLVWGLETGPPPAKAVPTLTVPKTETPVVTTNVTATHGPVKRRSLQEIQKLTVPEITRLAEEAVKADDRDYARLLVREGLLKEPDNPELLRLIKRLLNK